jgi:hypothetical protein
MESTPVLDELTLGKMLFDLCLDEDLRPSFDLSGGVRRMFRRDQIGEKYADHLLLRCEKEGVYPKEVCAEIQSHMKAYAAEEQVAFRRFVGILSVTDVIFAVVFVVAGLWKKWPFIWIMGIIVAVIALICLLIIVQSRCRYTAKRQNGSICPVFEGNPEEILTERFDPNIFENFLDKAGYPSCQKAGVAIKNHEYLSRTYRFRAPVPLVVRPLRRYLKVIGSQYPEGFRNAFETILSLAEKGDLQGTAGRCVVMVVILFIFVAAVGVFAAGVGLGQMSLACGGGAFMFICQFIPGAADRLLQRKPLPDMRETLESECRRAVPVIDTRQKEQRAQSIMMIKEICEARWNQRPFTIPPEIAMREQADNWWTLLWIRRLVQEFSKNSKQIQARESKERAYSGNQRVSNEC